MSSSFERRMSELEALLAEAERALTGRPLEVVRAIVGTLMESHREALRELFDRLSQDAEGRARLERLADTPGVAAMLSLHGLHVQSAEQRVRGAIREVDTAIGEGGLVEVLSVNGTHAHVRITARDAQAAREMADAVLSARAPDVTVDYEIPGAGGALIPAGSLVRGERCDVCGGRLPEEHEHLLDADTNRIRCACARCGTTSPTPSTRRIVAHADKIEGPTEAEWETLGIPVGLAAVVVDSRHPEPVVLYPGAAGLVHGAVQKGAWEALRASYPSLSVEPDVEAVLVYSAGGRMELYRVGIDTCFRLVGVLRQRSTQPVAARVRTFFDELGGAS